MPSIFSVFFFKDYSSFIPSPLGGSIIIVSLLLPMSNTIHNKKIETATVSIFPNYLNLMPN